MNFLFHHRVSAVKTYTYYAVTSGLGRLELKMLAKAITSLGLKVEDGEYDFNDVVTIQQTIGLNPMPTKIKSIYRGMHIPAEKQLTFGEISHLWARFLTERKHEETMIRLAFEYFDKDDSGYITSDEFVAAMSELGDPLTENEVATFLKHFDVDSDGKVRREQYSRQPASLLLSLQAAPPSSWRLILCLLGFVNCESEERKGLAPLLTSLPSPPPPLSPRGHACTFEKIQYSEFLKAIQSQEERVHSILGVESQDLEEMLSSQSKP